MIKWNTKAAFGLSQTFSREFLPENKQNSSGAYQGPKYFSYKGKTLNELRKESDR